MSLPRPEEHNVSQRRKDRKEESCYFLACFAALREILLAPWVFHGSGQNHQSPASHVIAKIPGRFVLERDSVVHFNLKAGAIDI